MSETQSPLLAADEPAPVTTYNESGASPFLIVADHAGNQFPRALGRLGVTGADCKRHIAWDVGIAPVSRRLAEALDATLIEQNYSRLVIDCNRAPGRATSIPEISEATAVPGNVGLNDRDKAQRAAEIFQPYHGAIEAELERRRQTRQSVALVAMHSFTPVFRGVARPWHIGLLYNRDARFARPLLALLKREPGFVVGDKEPYGVSDETDYTIPVHGERRDLPHIGIEIRQDLITTEQGQSEWAARLARLLPQAYRDLLAAEAPEG